MSASKDSLKQTLVVSFLLCLVCSVIVSAAVVLLKQRQDDNKKFERYSNVLAAAGLYKPGEHTRAEVQELFSSFEVRLVDLDTGQYLTDEQMAALGIDPAKYDQRKAAKDPELGEFVPADQDIASIKRQAKYALVYLTRAGDKLERVVLPVHGYGLWSTLYGYLAVGGDGNSVLGLTFYEHAETPGLGGEVDNPKWKAQWPGKRLADEGGAMKLHVIKGKAERADDYTVDGLSGATLTTRGVDNLIQYWLGERGFGPYLARIRAGEA